MKMYIPTCGDIIRLTSDWTFALYNEPRNRSLMEYTNDTRKTSYFKKDETSLPCIIPAVSELKIDRIYIRKNASEFDSITFVWRGVSIPARTETQNYTSSYYADDNNPSFIQKEKREIRIPKQAIRFWAKLNDVNNIEFEQVISG